MIVATVARRGRVAVAEPYFAVAPPLTLGRRAMAELEIGELVAVEQTGRGNARLLTRIGRPHDITAVMHALALDAGVADASPERPQPAATEATAEGRVDMRGLFTFTVDPGDARDHDDALSVEDDGGRPIVHVHIADVAAFVPPGSDLDLDAEERATSVYLPGRVDAMLPLALSAGACSLVPGEDRPAVTVTLSPGRAPRFRRTTIRSRHRLSYEQADALIAGGEGPADLAAALRLASHTAARWRDERRTSGSLDLETGEISFTISGGRVRAARREFATTPAHRMIEELMVRANEAVAATLVRGREPTLFRVHEPPDPESVLALAARLEELDVPAPALGEQPQPREAAAWLSAVALRVRAVRPQVLGDALTSLVLRALQQARYDPHNLGHSGLASDAYCHFTSPIRRYPDLVCHRALLHRLGLAERDERELGELAVHCSAREREAAALEHRGVDICLAHLLHDRLEQDGWQHEFAGVVVSVAGFGMFVRFAEVFEGLAPLRLLEERYELDGHGVALVSSSGHRVRAGDELAVRVKLVDRIRGRVTLEVTGWGRM